MRTLVVVAVSCLVLVTAGLGLGAWTRSGTPTPTSATTSPVTGPAGVVARDVYGPHDATPRGVPHDYSWRDGSDADPEVASTEFDDYRAVNVWGQVFATSSTTSPTGRLEVRGPRLWWLTDDGWVEAELDVDVVEGGYYSGDFRSGAVQASARRESAGTWSMPLSGLDGTADALHFWWVRDGSRLAIPNGTRGILVVQEMRLTADASGAEVIGSTGADLFASPRTVVHPQGWNPGIPNSRMTWVTSSWQTFYATTVDLTMLQRNPPPIED